MTFMANTSYASLFIPRSAMEEEETLENFLFINMVTEISAPIGNTNLPHLLPELARQLNNENELGGEDVPLFS